jgi:hypothetical protein
MNATHERFGACPSRLRFDRLLARELNEKETHEVELHAQSCLRCGPLLVELRRGYQAFAPELPDVLVQRVRAREARARTGKYWFAPTLAAAAALVVWLARPHDAPPATRSKGSPQLSFYVLHDGVVRPGVDGERVRPGDALRFAYSSSRDAYLAIVSIDGARAASAYYAEQGARAAKVVAGSRALLDQSTVLDETLGPEIVYGLLCSEPILLAPVLQALERQPDTPPDVPGCTLDRYTLFKVAR